MTYKITSVSQNDDTITTFVEFQLNSTQLNVSIPHFRPVSVNQIIDNIVNRGLSEQTRLDAIASCSSLLSLIPINETVTF